MYTFILEPVAVWNTHTHSPSWIYSMMLVQSLHPQTTVSHFWNIINGSKFVCSCSVLRLAASKLYQSCFHSSESPIKKACCHRHFDWWLNANVVSDELGWKLTPINNKKPRTDIFFFEMFTVLGFKLQRSTKQRVYFITDPAWKTTKAV